MDQPQVGLNSKPRNVVWLFFLQILVVMSWSPRQQQGTDLSMYNLMSGSETYGATEAYSPYLPTGFSPPPKAMSAPMYSPQPYFQPTHQNYFAPSIVHAPAFQHAETVRTSPRRAPAGMLSSELPVHPAAAVADPPAKRRRGAATLLVPYEKALSFTSPPQMQRNNSAKRLVPVPVLPTPSPVAADAGGGQAPSKHAGHGRGGGSMRGRAVARTGSMTGIPKPAVINDSEEREETGLGRLRMVTFQTQLSGGKLKEGRQVGQDILAPIHEQLPDDFEVLLGHPGINIIM